MRNWWLWKKELSTTTCAHSTTLLIPKEMECAHYGLHLWGNSASCFFIALTKIISLYFPHCQRQQEPGPPHNNRLTWKSNFKMVLQCAIESDTKTEYQLMKYVLQSPTKAEWKPYATEEKWIYRKKQPIASLAFAVFWKPAAIKYPLILC